MVHWNRYLNGWLSFWLRSILSFKLRMYLCVHTMALSIFSLLSPSLRFSVRPFVLKNNLFHENSEQEIVEIRTSQIICLFLEIRNDLKVIDINNIMCENYLQGCSRPISVMYFCLNFEVQKIT